MIGHLRLRRITAGMLVAAGAFAAGAASASAHSGDLDPSFGGDGKLITRPLGHDILSGITRSVVVDLIKAQRLAFEERCFTVEEAYAAREAFVTSASQFVVPVVSIDGRPVGNGGPGLIAAALRRDYHRHAEISE